MPKKRSTRGKARGGKARAAPAGFHTLTPYLTIRGAAQAIEVYKRAFGAEELNRDVMPDGRMLHARVKIGDSTLMMSDEFPEHGGRSPLALGGTPVTLHLYTKDVDKLWSEALAAGCKVTMPLEDQFWGERYGKLRDPFGHEWSVSQPLGPAAAKRLKEKREASLEDLMGGPG